MLQPAKRWKHVVAMVMIGDGVMALVRPQWDAEVWAVGPEWWKRSMRFFRDRPALTRAIAAAQIAGGIWWALSSERSGEPASPEELWSEAPWAA